MGRAIETGTPDTTLPDTGIPRAVHAWALGGFAVIIVVLALLYHSYAEVNLWANMEASGELRKAHYSETVHIDSIFRTRSNTWSNLAFVLVGLYALAIGFHDQKLTGWLHAASNATPPALTLLFGAACCYLGAGSGIFHASLTRWGQQLDVASMYPPMLVLIAMLVRRNLMQAYQWGGKTGKVLSGILIIAVAAAAVLLYVYKWSMSSGTVLPLHILTLAAFCAADRALWRPNGRICGLLAASLALAAGVLCRQLDVAGHFSDPSAWYQGHAFWHGLCALSLALAWWYLRDGERRLCTTHF